MTSWWTLGAGASSTGPRVPTSRRCSATRLCCVYHTSNNCAYDALLQKFPLFTTPNPKPDKVIHTLRHSIVTIGPQCFARSRRLPPERVRISQNEFRRMLQDGTVRPSSNCWTSPLHIVPKPQDGEWRPCSDYRALNAMTRPDRYPIPHVMDFHSKLHGQKKFLVVSSNRFLWQRRRSPRRSS